MPFFDAFLAWLPSRQAQRRQDATQHLWEALEVLGQPGRRNRLPTLEGMPATGGFGQQPDDLDVQAQRERQARIDLRRAIQQGADVNAPQPVASGPGPAPLEWALRRQQWSLAYDLLMDGADPNRMGVWPTPWGAGRNERSVPIVVGLGVWLLHQHAYRSSQDAWTLLHRMVERGGDLGWQDDSGATLLHSIALHGREFGVWSRDLLPWMGVRTTTRDGRNVLHEAAENLIGLRQDPSWFTALVRLGADPYQEDSQGHTPLLLLVRSWREHPEMVWPTLQALIRPEQGRPLDWARTTSDGQSALALLEAPQSWPPTMRDGTPMPDVGAMLRQQRVDFERFELRRAMDTAVRSAAGPEASQEGRDVAGGRPRNRL